jgi:hypothetical protein
MSAAVRKVVSEYPIGHEFHGNQLHNDVTAIYPKAERMYTDTLMRAMRRFCHHQYITVDHNKSLYRRVLEKKIFLGGKNERQGMVRESRGRNKQPQKPCTKTGETVQLPLFR